MQSCLHSPAWELRNWGEDYVCLVDMVGFISMLKATVSKKKLPSMLQPLKKPRLHQPGEMPVQSLKMKELLSVHEELRDVYRFLRSYTFEVSDTLPSMGPLQCLQPWISDSEDKSDCCTQRFLASSGSESKGSLYILQRAVPLEEQAEFDLPADARFSAVWALRQAAEQPVLQAAAKKTVAVAAALPPHRYVLISSPKRSMLLETTEEIEEISQPRGWDTAQPTLSAGPVLAGKLLVQLTPQRAFFMPAAPGKGTIPPAAVYPSGCRAVQASIRDPFIVLRCQDGSLKLLSVAEGPALRDHTSKLPKDLGAATWAALSGSESVRLAVLTPQQRGLLVAFDLSVGGTTVDVREVFRSAHLAEVPPVLRNTPAAEQDEEAGTQLSPSQDYLRPITDVSAPLSKSSLEMATTKAEDEQATAVLDFVGEVLLCHPQHPYPQKAVEIRWGHLHLQAASQLLDDANAACDLLSERLDTFSEHLNSSSGSWEQAADGVVAGTADDASFRHVLEDLSQELNCSRNHLTKALEQAEEVLSRLSEVQNELDALKRKMRGTPANYAEARAEDKNLCVEIDKRSSNYTQRTQNLADTVTSFMKALTGQRESMNLPQCNPKLELSAADELDYEGSLKSWQSTLMPCRRVTTSDRPDYGGWLNGDRILIPGPHDDVLSPKAVSLVLRQWVRGIPGRASLLASARCPKWRGHRRSVFESGDCAEKSIFSIVLSKGRQAICDLISADHMVCAEFVEVDPEDEGPTLIVLVRGRPVLIYRAFNSQAEADGGASGLFPFSFRLIEHDSLVHFRRHTRTMEEAPAMEAQQTSAEQPTEAALPAAETATETPSPIAAPPGVPMKAPPPSLLAKEEPKEPAPTPEIGQLITLTDDLQVVRFTNGTIHLKRAGKEPEAITPSMFDALLQSIRTQANASAPSAMSGFTGLASTNRGSAPGTDNDPIEWGDMDPNFRQALQDSPELLKAYNTVRNPKKVAKLDPATNSFTPTTNIELPPPSVETPPPQVTMENLSTVLATYHEQTVQPSLDLLSNHIRQDVISRLDKQGSVIRYEGLALQSLEADAIRRTVLIHGLPPFTTKSQIDHNLHYLLQQAQLTESDIQTTSNHVNTSTNAFLKITFLQESTSKHFFQTFKQKKRWYHSNEAEDAPLRIERDVPMLERIERAPLHAVIDSLTKPQPPAMDEYLRCDFNSLQVWDNAEESLLAQVLYLPDKNLSYACYLLVVPRFFEEVREHFPRFFGDKLSSTIQFMQAYAAASRHATTALRYHFSQTKDVSNISREDAIRSFPYPIYPIELHDELSTQLSKNPNFILQGFLGMQTQIQQAVSDLGINLEDYGRKGKGTARNKGKGKGKRSDRKGYQSDMYRNPAEEEEDTDEDYKDYKPKSGKGSSWRQGQNYWDRSNYAASSSRDTGKGSYSQWSDYRRPASSRVDYSGPKDRPEKWWKARDFDDYDPRFDELVQDSTRRRREDDRQQEGRHTRQRGRGLDDPTLYFPCEKLNYAMEVRLLLLMVMVSAMLARWLSLATLLLARMANFVLSSLLEWSRLLVHILQTHWEDKAPHWKAKIYHWYAFTNGTIHNWPPSLGPSVMARSQTNRHASGGMKEDLARKNDFWDALVKQYRNKIKKLARKVSHPTYSYSPPLIGGLVQSPKDVAQPYRPTTMLEDATGRPAGVIVAPPQPGIPSLWLAASRNRPMGSSTFRVSAEADAFFPG
ncbi:Cleavage and polyadenylation specificity factor subunit 1 [Symbiodinium microadriaticum]|uniref:Cleavage and polyadenylation specificity factor subunit 1 n=1 Tax=Symbiodinium microadriaticum TaxID=2951 RepID=A0A1Q9E199_SYMMI|nr:Cleavage and polyadenylation specificity factor subunit 1 [Symbiodinium microadriaticum]